MNPNYFFIYFIFSLITIIITLILMVNLGRLPVTTVESDDKKSNNILLIGISFLATGIIFKDLFPTVSSTLNLISMQSEELYGNKLFRILLTYAGITLISILVSFLISLLVFKLLKSQLKETNSSIILQIIFSVILIIMLLAANPIVVEFFNFYQPSVKTPFFK